LLLVLGTSGCSSNPERVHFLVAQHLERLLLVERHRAVQLCGPELVLDLRGVDTLMPEPRANLLEVMVLLENLHRNAVAHVVQL